MSASRFAAVNIVPLLGRILLCAAFVPAGYDKIFSKTELTTEQAARLDAIGWSWTPPPLGVAPAAPPIAKPATPAPAATTPAPSKP
ncbi:MAG: hypothetical protein FJ253_12410, partial [Phycisphaerae bacterium]|nr:hypothetical protein [Phycisphaerae bacterium]